jgi:hypothetical protein
MTGKLFIYDTSDDGDDQADGRFDDMDDVTTVATDSKEGLIAGLDGLVRAGARFDRVLFQTHGGPGNIRFNGLTIWDRTLREKFGGRNYHALFPVPTRIYFDGCNVAGGSLGTEFLEAAGEVFLRSAGGETVGFTTPGYGFSGWVPFVGGHTIHFSGGLKRIRFGPGGVVLSDGPTRNPLDDYGKPNVGNKI